MIKGRKRVFLIKTKQTMTGLAEPFIVLVAILILKQTRLKMGKLLKHLQQAYTDIYHKITQLIKGKRQTWPLLYKTLFQLETLPGQNMFDFEKLVDFARTSTINTVTKMGL